MQTCLANGIFTVFCRISSTNKEATDNIFTENQMITGFFLPFYVDLFLLTDVSEVFLTSIFIKFGLNSLQLRSLNTVKNQFIFLIILANCNYTFINMVALYNSFPQKPFALPIVLMSQCNIHSCFGTV